MKTIKILLSFIMLVSLCACDLNHRYFAKKYKKFKTQLLDSRKTNHLLTNKDIIDDSNDNENQTDIIVHTKDETIRVSYHVKKKDSTYTGLDSLSEVSYMVSDPYNVQDLDTSKYDFSFGAASNGKPHHITVDNQNRFDRYGTNALAWDNKSNEKVLYLTFDCGYEYENLTSLMLDTLKDKEVTAAFFCTQSYLNSSADVVARMIAEGHIVGNHSVNHPSNCAVLTKEELAKEVLGVHNYLRVNFGYQSKYK